jgi:hypothetical protein
MANRAQGADLENRRHQLAAKGKDMTADQLKRKLRNFPAAKLTGLAALSA